MLHRDGQLRGCGESDFFCDDAPGFGDECGGCEGLVHWPAVITLQFIVEMNQPGYLFICIVLVLANYVSSQRSRNREKVVVEGRLDPSGRLQGDKLLTRCASKYERGAAEARTARARTAPRGEVR